MQQVRVLEQRKAAYVGEYACQIQLGFTSSQVKNPKETVVVEDHREDPAWPRSPEVVYLHNPADKHDTHIGVTMRTIAALRAVRDREQPKKVYGCEVWRDLDWMPDEEKQVLARERALQHRRGAGRRLRFPGQRRQAVRSRYRRPPAGARDLLRFPRHRPGKRAELRHGPDSAGRRPVAIRRGLCPLAGRSFSRGRGPPREFSRLSGQRIVAASKISDEETTKRTLDKARPTTTAPTPRRLPTHTPPRTTSCCCR